MDRDLLIFFFNGENYSHIIVGLPGGSLAQVFHKLAGQDWRSTKVKAEILNLLRMPSIAHLFLVEDTMGALKYTN